MLWIFVILMATLFIAYANGANDNFKGVATLFGSGTTNYKWALWWATLTTFLGSVAAIFFAHKLIKTFTGYGLVPAALIINPTFIIAVALGAGATVFIAARIGIPISTTHSLIGALAGVGLLAVGREFGFAMLLHTFFIPLLVSPLAAVFGVVLLYPLLSWCRARMGVSKETCVCIGERQLVPVAAAHAHRSTAVPSGNVDLIVDSQEKCDARAVEVYAGKFFGVRVHTILDALHFLSAGAVSFARGLNDTPKIVALAVAGGALGLQWNVGLVGVAIALGGLLSARRIAHTMACRITGMNHGQGLTSNVITAALVIFASRLGVPVSTTHVSCGALFGLGLVNGQANWPVIWQIVSAWVLTLPLAACLAAGCFWILQGVVT